MKKNHLNPLYAIGCEIHVPYSRKTCNNEKNNDFGV